ncbi:hypothetical protein NQ318_007101 [Aromia moschata]|uniref:DUF4817 domain-containing protein n=1 Tax=Aromia moschata TaxID=1265417 RepID=A0AAV8XU77_9CUCU|nr:hypothetical protein NQ318_007101 [Aromia moschata]
MVFYGHIDGVANFIEPICLALSWIKSLQSLAVEPIFAVAVEITSQLTKINPGVGFSDPEYEENKWFGPECFYTAAKSNLVRMLYSEFETKCYFKLVKMSYLTESLKIEILMMIGYGDRARTQCEVVRLFRETHPDLPPLNQGTISKIEAQYREMGHVRKVPSKRQAVVDDDTKLNLLLALEENPITPARHNWPVIVILITKQF